MGGMQNKMAGMGMISGQTGGAVGHMGQMQGMQNSAILTQINQISQGNMPQQMVQIGPGQMGQMASQMGGVQSQQNMQVCILYEKKTYLKISELISNGSSFNRIKFKIRLLDKWEDRLEEACKVECNSR